MSNPSSDRGSSDRLARWTREHGGVVRGFLRARLRDEHAADDLLQEVFLRAWSARDRYRDDGRERSYLLRIADRLACDRLRRSRRERDWETEDGVTREPIDRLMRPDEAAANDESAHQLHEALEQLTEPQRRTLLLRYFGNLDFQEIAHALDAPLNTVLSHGRRGLLALQKLLTNKLT